MSDLAAMVAYLDPGGPDEGQPWEWLREYDQEAFTPRARAAQPAPEPDPELEDPPELTAYAAHRERGLAPGAAAWAAVHGPEPELAEAEAG